MKKSDSAIPSDQGARDLILSDLDSSMLVEASAGTGKTTIAIGRMVNLLARGKCTVDTLAAVTFTNKAASELRSRFQMKLEEAARKAIGEEALRLRQALGALERTFVGTFHSFCGALLRERPIEAGVDPNFVELDEVQDENLRSIAWAQHAARLNASNDPLIDQLDELGLHLGQLGSAFSKFALYPDAEEWPAPEVELANLGTVRKAFLQYAAHMQSLEASFPEDLGRDKLMPKYRRLARRTAYFRREIETDTAVFLDVLDIINAPLDVKKIVQSRWPGGPEQAKEELARWEHFRIEHVEPLVEAWRALRYHKVMRVLQGGVEEYDRLRASRGVLNFQDLLMKAASLLRDKPSIRLYFQRRFTHLLVDEFQDTDPVQAEVVLYLTASDVHETNWRKCRPRPGSLFVVGDPKQSIYRFRRADIVTYNHVKSIVVASGGKTPSLSSNFRTEPPLIAWVNQTFKSEFPAKSEEASPAYVSLQYGRSDNGESAVGGIYKMSVPADFKNSRQLVVEYEAEKIARFIRRALDEKKTISRPGAKPADTPTIPAGPGDFMIITQYTKFLGTYARKLQEHGIPHQVTGGSALNEASELRLLGMVVGVVVHPEDPVRLVALLRSAVFGISDQALYVFQCKGGQFFFLSPVPESFTGIDGQRMRDVFNRLMLFRSWFGQYPVVTVVEKIISNLGLLASSAARLGGDEQAGALAKTVELLRALPESRLSPNGVVAYLERLIEKEDTFDGIAACGGHGAAVRVMNLHKAKGLEAPVVFLADAGGVTPHEPDIHVDRSGERIRGYMAVLGEKKEHAEPPCLAAPLGWSMWALKESPFQDWEKVRLLYVAATRAGSQLVIPLRSTYQNMNPWQRFSNYMSDIPELDTPMDSTPAVTVESRPYGGELALSTQAIWESWKDLCVPSYAVAAAKQVALDMAPISAIAKGTGGAAWGTVIHWLLEAATKADSSTLHNLAIAALQDQDLPKELADTALSVVDGVRQSKIWARAEGSLRRMNEVSFEFVAPSDHANAIPMLIRGVIDLAFEEPDGWVIVDYKTDRVSGKELQDAVVRYSLQLNEYVKAWYSCAKLPVKECGLYFTHAKEYIPIRRDGG